MKDKLDNTEQLIQKEFHNEADSIEKDVETICADEVVTEKITDEIRSNVDKNIDQYEKERIYSLLPEEDKKALEIGRRIQRKKPGKRKKMYLSLAAALVLAMAIGVTSLGGPERVVRLIKYSLGEREVKKINSGEEVAISQEEKEEEAYQEIKNEFGSDPVKIIARPAGMTFNRQDLDRSIQTAEMYYDYNGEKLIYIINASYSNASLGIDVEDEKVSQRELNLKGCDIEFTEYNVKGKSKYSASFSYKGLEYYILGVMEEEDFLYILNNLYFF